MAPVRVYVSSTYTDLKELRSSVIGAIRKVPNHAPVNMEDYAADGRRPLDKCLDDVRTSNVYVGVIGSRAGFVPEGHQVSITRLEYEEGWKHRLPCLFFLQPLVPTSADDAADRERVEQFRELVQNRHTIKKIEHPKELGEDVMKGLFEQALRAPHVLGRERLETNAANSAARFNAALSGAPAESRSRNRPASSRPFPIAPASARLRS